MLTGPLLLFRMLNVLNKLDDMDIIEINEAFSTAVWVCTRSLYYKDPRFNLLVCIAMGIKKMTGWLIGNYHESLNGPKSYGIGSSVLDSVWVLRCC